MRGRFFGRLTGWGMVVGFAPCAASAAPPVLTGFQLLTPTVSTASPLASPAFKLNLTGNATFIAFTYNGPSGESFSQFFQAPQGFGSVAVLQAYIGYQYGGANEMMFSPYAEPGTWSISSLSICGSQCSLYDGSHLSASTFKIVNPHQPDIQPPALVSGAILTPTVSLASGLPVNIQLHVTDDVSGVQIASACAVAPGVVSQLCVTAPLPVHRTVDGTFVATAVPPAGTAPGTYTLQQLLFVDAAGNWNAPSPASIARYFPAGKLSITITP